MHGTKLWLVAGPMGLGLRYLIEGRMINPLIFISVTMGTVYIFIFAWRISYVVFMQMVAKEKHIESLEQN